MSSLETLDLSALLDLPEDVIAAITNARVEFANLSAERENEASTVAAERETERANTNRRIRGLEDALGALSTRPDETLSSLELPPATGTYNDLVGDFLPSERTDTELETSIMQIVSKAERLRLSATDKSKLYATFIKGSTSKFRATSTIVGLEEISTIENISSFAQLRIELQKHITSVSVHPVFLILKFDEDDNLIDPDSAAGVPINLLSVNILPPLTEIEKSMQFYHRRGSTFNRENLAWSLEAVRNSCDKDLQVILDAKMLRYKPSERFGPLYYYELVRQMTDVDSKAIRGITQELTSLKVTDQEGQSIAKTASIIRSTMIWLEMVKMVPPDIDAIVLDILESCTVPDFALFLKTLSTNASLNGISLSHSDLLERAEGQYRTLVISKKWDAVGHQGSSFQAQRLPAASARTNENPRPRVNMPSWSRTPPADNEPHERTFESTLFKWCSICQRWFFGHRAHLTEEHTPGHPSRGRRATASTPSTSATAPISPGTHLAATSTPESTDSNPSPPPSSLSRPISLSDIPPPKVRSTYQPVERHLFGASTLCQTRRTQTELFHLISQHLLSSSSLGFILRKTLYYYVLSRLYAILRCLLLLPLTMLRLMFPLQVSRPYPSIFHLNPIVVHALPSSPPAVLQTTAPPFDSCLRLISTSITSPLALNTHVTRSDFDPDFVATLLSRQAGHDVVDVILDTGCTFSITPDRRDFISYTEGGFVGQVQTVNGPTAVAGTGIVRWTLISEDGAHVDLLIPCHHVPASTIRLLSPQDFCQSQGFDRSTDQFGGNSNYFWMHADHQHSRFRCPIDPRSNLPVALAKTPCNPGGCQTVDLGIDNHSSCPSCQRHSIVSFSVLEETNQNITAAQKDLLLWHFRLGHLGFAHLQHLMRPRTVEDIRSHVKSEKPIIIDPCIVPKNPSTRTCKPPLCASCQIARAKRRPTDVATTTVHQESLLKVSDLQPGSRVSIDQYESSVRGRLATTKGRESFGHKYAGGTIFCDHASGFIQCSHQVSLRAADTLVSKRAFERTAKSCGVKIKNYHGDNGVFKSKEFIESITKSEQELTLSGVGAHHQNGVAERSIRTVTEKARTMMQHAYIHWPDEFQVDLWPFALDYACWLHNHTPSHSHGWSPLELFCGTQVDCQHLQRARVWGCPSYVLSPTLQDGKKIPKWAPRARRGQFLGFSKDHSSMIGIIRNIQTGSVTPQFHVVFDELFTTVHSLDEDVPTWVELFTSERDYYGPDEEEEDADTLAFPDLDPAWLPDSEIKIPPAMQQSTVTTTDTTTTTVTDVDSSAEIAEGPEDPDDGDIRNDDTPNSTEYGDAYDDQVPLETPIRSTRTRRPNRRVFGNEWTNHTVQLTPSSRTLLGHIIPSLNHDDLFLHSLDWDIPFSANYGSFDSLNLLHVDPYNNEVDWIHPFTLGAKASSADTPTLRDIQQMSPDEIERWYDAMDVELQALRNKKTMTEINRCDVPKGKQIVKSTWAFKRKRRPNGEIYKLKARFVVRGDLQRLDDTDSTFSPVVDWSTVRLLFILTVAQRLKSVTIDFNAAFVQSDLPEPIYLELPPGYAVPNEDKVYKVDKSLYGDVRAARLWYKHLSAALVAKMGFTKSTIDSCLYLRDDLVFVFYVDDGIIISPDESKVQHFIGELRECNFDLDIEADYAGYLGVDIISQPDGTLLMAQTGLIERILADLGLTDSTSTKATPAAEMV